MYFANNSPKKICVLRLSAIGDVTHVLPVINAIQQQWPQTDITWVCGKIEYQLLRIVPNVRFIVFNKKEGFKAIRKLWRKLRNEQFDVLLHMQVAARANVISLGIKAKVKLGWDKKRSRDLHQFFTTHKIPEEREQHQVQAFLSFARTLGLSAKRPDWKIPVTATARQFAQQHLANDRKILVISACSSHRLRNWMAQRYASVADYAVRKHAMQIVLSGGPSPLESEMAEEIMQCMEYTATNLVGKDTLEQLVGLLSCASVVISPDSGPVHLANAVGVPVIGLYACTWSKRSGPYHSLEYCVDKFDLAAKEHYQKPASQLRWGTKIEREGVMELIEVDEVCRQLNRVLERQNGRKTAMQQP